MVAPLFTRVYDFWRKVGNRLITLIFNLANNTTFTDICSCYLMYRRPLVAPESLKTVGWEQHAEILSRAAAGARSMYEVPISYHGSTYAKDQKIKAYHAIGVIRTIVNRRLLRQAKGEVPLYAPVVGVACGKVAARHSPPPL